MFTDSACVIRRERAQKTWRPPIPADGSRRGQVLEEFGGGVLLLTKLGLGVLEDSSRRRRWQDEEEDKALSFNAVQCVRYYLAALEHGGSSKQLAAWVCNIKAGHGAGGRGDAGAADPQVDDDGGA